MLLDRAPDGMPLLSRLPFLAGERVGNSVVDTLMVGHMVAGWRPSCLPDEVRGRSPVAWHACRLQLLVCWQAGRRGAHGRAANYLTVVCQ